MKVLQAYKKINVSSLAKMLHVTEVTIRKDLEQLEQAGFLIRQHGGAILREEIGDAAAPLGESTGFPLFPAINSQGKRDIAQVCFRLIQDEDILFLGGDDICCLIAQQLQKASQLTHVIVVTNSLYISLILSQSPFVTLLSPGGQLYQFGGHLSYYGAATVSALQQYYFTKLFLNADAVSFEAGFMVSSQEAASLYQAILPRSDETIAVFDASKFGKRSLHRLLGLTEAGTVVSGPNLPAEFKQYCFEHNIKLFTAVQDVLTFSET